MSATAGNSLFARKPMSTGSAAHGNEFHRTLGGITETDDITALACVFAITAKTIIARFFFIGCLFSA